MSDIRYKTCSRRDECVNPQGAILPATNEFFHADRTTADGLKPLCKFCARAARRNYLDRPDNRERGREYQRNRRANMTPEQKEHDRQMSNTPELKEYRRRYMRDRRRDPEYRRKQREQQASPESKQKRREALHRYKTSEKGRLRNRERMRAYRQTPVGQANMKAANLRRKMRKRASASQVTPKQWKRCLDYFNHQCAICGRTTDFWTSLSADHWIPISKGGATDVLNIVPLCHAKAGVPYGDTCCNRAKSDRDALEWLISTYGERKGKRLYKKIEAYFDWVRKQERGD